MLLTLTTVLGVVSLIVLIPTVAPWVALALALPVIVATPFAFAITQWLYEPEKPRAPKKLAKPRIEPTPMRRAG